MKSLVYTTIPEYILYPLRKAPPDLSPDDPFNFAWWAPESGLTTPEKSISAFP
jgi:hypothetical protein